MAEKENERLSDEQLEAREEETASKEGELGTEEASSAPEQDSGQASDLPKSESDGLEAGSVKSDEDGDLNEGGNPDDEPLSEGADVESLAARSEENPTEDHPAPEDNLTDDNSSVDDPSENEPDEGQGTEASPEPEPEEQDQQPAETPEEKPEPAEDSQAADSDQGPSQPDPDTEILSDDEIGISLSDDELWDDTDVEEIPLFEDQLLDEELGQGTEEAESPGQEASHDKNTEEIQKESADVPGEQAQGQEHAVQEEKTAPEQTSDGRSDDAGQESLDQEAASGKAPEEQAGPAVEQAASAAEEEKAAPEQEPSPPPSGQEPAAAGAECSCGLSPFIPWIVTSVATILFIGAIITFGFLMNSAVEGNLGPAIQKDRPAAPAKTEQADEVKALPLSPSSSSLKRSEATGQIDSLMLHSFLIPSKLGGQTVFYKLRIELVVPDTTTKHSLARKEAWVRDIIYQELKGMKIERTRKGDVLARYKKPLKERLNKALKPYNIEILDVRMSGYILK